MAVVGYRYFFGIHMGIGRGPVNELCEIRVGDRRAWIGSVTDNTTINIDAPELFGGDEREGGVQGPLELMFGAPTQTASAGLLATLGSPLPGFRGRFTAFFNGLIGSNNPYPKAWKFRIRRTTAGWDGPVLAPEFATILIRAEDPIELPTEPTPVGPPPHTPIPEGWIGVGITDLAEDGSDVGGAFFPGIGGGLGGWAKPPPLVVDTSGEPPFGWLRAYMNEPGSYYFPNAADQWWYKPAPPPIVPPDTTASSPPAGWVVTFNGDPYGYFFPNVPMSPDMGAWFRPNPNPEENYATVPPEGWIITTADDPYRVWFPAYGYYKPADAGTEPDPEPETEEVVMIHAANGAHIIYECLTNREWGRGMLREQIDEISFISAAAQLHSEKFGLCMKWTRTDEIQAFVQQVLDHIGGVIFVSRKTAKMTLRLIRGDYSLDDLPTYTNDTGLLEIREATFAPSGMSVNTIHVQYHDPLNDKERSVTVSNNAAIQAARGVINTATRTYKGLPVPSLALRVGQRDLRASSTALRRYTITMDRRGFQIEPGSVIAIEDRSRGIQKTAVRVGRVDAGSLTSGRITITAVQDVFSIPARSFINAVPNQWQPPNVQPCNGDQLAFEVPYFFLARTMTPADLDYVNENGGFVAVASAQGKALNAGVKVAVRPDAPTPDDDPPDTAYTC